MHKNARLVASDQRELAEQRLPLEGDAEHAAVDADGFSARAHQERRGGASGRAERRTDFH